MQKAKKKSRESCSCEKISCLNYYWFVSILSVRRMDDDGLLRAALYALNLSLNGFSAKGRAGPATWRCSCSSRVLLM